MIPSHNNKTRVPYVVLLILLIIGCNEQDNWISPLHPDDFPQGSIRFQSLINHLVTTRGDVQQTHFDAFTLFRLYATYDGQGSRWTSSAAQVPNLYDALTTATPRGQGGINYRDYNGNKTALYDEKIVTTFAVSFNEQATFDSNDNIIRDENGRIPGYPVPDVQKAPDGAPRFTIATDAVSGKLPDLMRGYSAGRRVTDGIINPLQFNHTLSRIRFEVLRDDVLKGVQDANMKLKNITILNIPTKGTYDLGQNEYVNLTEKTNRVVFDGNMALDATESMLWDHQMLVFPMSNTSMGDTLRIYYELEIYGNESITGTVKLPAYNFLPNKDYLITLLCVGGDVQILIFSPKVYDWIEIRLNPNEENPDAPEDYYISQLVTFGGVTWMDRNLGAKSGDCQNDWDNTRGYYYQFGRNIPYIFDKEKWDYYIDSLGLSVVKNSTHLTYQGRPRENVFFYTVNQHGERIYEAYNAGNSATAANLYNINTLAVNPGDDKPLYGIVISASLTWMYANPGFTSNYADIRNYWSTVDKHPCPKGWKLPSKEDMVSFLPDPMMESGTGTVNAAWNNSTGYYYRAAINGTVLPDRISEIIAGKDIWGYPSFYMLKNIGIQGQQYFIRMRRLTTPVDVTTARLSAGNVKQGYYEFCRYPAGEDDSLDGLNTKEKFLASKYGVENGKFWNSPQERMLIPACGVIGLASTFTTIEGEYTVTPSSDDAGLFGDGQNVRVRTSDPNNYYQGYLCFFQQVSSGTNLGNLDMGLKSSSTYGAGAQIRCVRDLQAK